MRKPLKKKLAQEAMLKRDADETRRLRIVYGGGMVIMTALLATVLFIGWQRGMAGANTKVKSKWARDGWWDNTLPTSSVKDQQAGKWVNDWMSRNVRVK